ncbi:MAG: molybdate ABC transporter substrate-binding protein [Betaproteobacteria bacterium]|nr:molybdate ABC transporter substrate-binding protein [Betaproteobacteria bacterium]
MRHLRQPFATLLCGLAVLFTASTRADTVTVFAAASLKESLEAAAGQFEAASGHKIVISFAASSALARQIEAGAPADLFISADLDWAEYLEKKQLFSPGTRINLLKNGLVLIAPVASTATLKLAPGINFAPIIGERRIAMANPEVVPAGRYGKAALQALGAWESIKGKVAGAENVRAALALVSRGEAPLGIVYRTDALADKGVRIVDTFPANTHPPIVYPAAVMAGSKTPAAKAFLAHLSARETQAVWQRFGFTTAR